MADIIYENSQVWIHGPQSGGGYKGKPNISMNLKVYKEVRSGSTLSIDVEASLNGLSLPHYFGYNLTVSAKLDNGSAVQLFNKPNSPNTWSSGTYTSGRKTLQSNNSGTVSTLYILFNSSSCPCHKSAGTVTVASFELKDLIPANYTVTFDLKGGTRTGGGALSQSVSPGGSATAPTTQKTGHILSGWDKALTNISENTTISAIWSPYSHNVVYDLNSGSANGGDFKGFSKTYGSVNTITSSIPVKYRTATFDPSGGEVASFGKGVSVTKSGKAKFLGWETTVGGKTYTFQPGDTYGLDKNGDTVTLKAIWGDAQVSYPSEPVLEDNIFLGWFYNNWNAYAVNNKHVTISEDLTFTARYYTSKIKQYDASASKWRPWLPKDVSASNVNNVYIRKNGVWKKEGKVKKYDDKSKTWKDL